MAHQTGELPEGGPPQLGDLQRWMSWIITDSRGVADALADRAGEPAPSALGAVVSAPPLSREARLDIYAEAYFERLVEVLEDDYAAVKRVLGEELFRSLLVDYLDAHPSRHPSAAKLGTKLPGFLRTHDLSEDLPYLPDLAALEWMIVEAFFARDLPPLSLERLRGVREDEWPRVVVRLDPSVRLLHSRWNVDAVWQSEEQPAEESERRLVVYRRDHKVRVEPLERLAFGVLEWLGEGLTLTEVCCRLEGVLDVEAPMPPLMEWFKDWVSSGVIRDLSF